VISTFEGTRTMTGVLGLLLRLLLRAFGVIAHEAERPVGPPASVTYPRPEQTGIDHVGWPEVPRRAPDLARVRSAMAQRAEGMRGFEIEGRDG
jgi:hypothetical protein